MSDTVTRTYERFPLARRIEHLVMLLSFTTLALTGLPQKFSSADLSIALVSILGGIENLRKIHHFAAIVMMLVATMTAVLVTNSGRSAWFIGVLLINVYLVFAATLYLLPTTQ